MGIDYMWHKKYINLLDNKFEHNIKKTIPGFMFLFMDHL